MDIENKVMVTSAERERGRGNISLGEQEVQTTKYKINYEAILYNKELYTTFYNNYKWSITFKNCESL